MTPWCDDLVCSWRRLLADRHSLPFPWTLSLHRRWCPSASHHPLTFLFLPALTFPLPSPFPSLGLFPRRPRGGEGSGGGGAIRTKIKEGPAPVGTTDSCDGGSTLCPPTSCMARARPRGGGLSLVRDRAVLPVSSAMVVVCPDRGRLCL